MMNKKNTYNPKIHHRRSIRLKGYDYSQAGLYFVTICCQDKICRFGDVVNGEMQLNDAGAMVKNEWLKLPERFNNIQLHEYIVMPNHFHAILEIVVPKNKTLGNMVGSFQSIVTVKYIRGVKTLGWQPFNGKLWQRNYWENIIRNEQPYQRITTYIRSNPAQWEKDKFHKRSN